MAEALIGNEVASTGLKRTQTFIVTHDGAGNRLPLMGRSFMSFSFGGKHIEDFQLVVTLGDRLSKNLYADFEDATSEYTTIDGQYYWGTRMHGNTLDFTLSTDYMTQNMVDDFKHWFRPGVERDLILAEHPNRFIRARVATAPSMSMIPFGEEAVYIINKTDNEETKKTYKTKTTIYKGEIQLSFTMCEPYWTGILNYMPYPGQGVRIAAEQDPMQQRIIDLLNTIANINTLTNQDALKICLEDGIPHDNVLYSDNDFSIGIKDPYTDTVLLSMVPGKAINGEQTVNTPENEIDSEVARDKTTWARTYDEEKGYQYFLSVVKTATADLSHADLEDATLGYLITTNAGFNFSGDSDDDENIKYLFYSGTAPSKPILNFTMQLIKDDDDGYITHPLNSFSNSDDDDSYSYIRVGSHEFKFTTPSICTMYNKVLTKLDEAKDTEYLIDTKNYIRENIKDKYVRQWFFYCIQDKNESMPTPEAWDEEVREKFTSFFVPQTKWIYDYITNRREKSEEYHAEFEFNSKTGEAIGTFKCKTPYNEEGVLVTENVGDMVLSKYLIIDERNHLVDGRIILNNCTEITTNEQISNFKLIYNNMYL